MAKNNRRHSRAKKLPKSSPQNNPSQKPALPRTWLVPIRLSLSAVVLAGVMYIFFNIGSLGMGHIFLFMAVMGVVSMVFLDCKMSERHWAEQDKKAEKEAADLEEKVGQGSRRGKH